MATIVSIRCSVCGNDFNFNVQQYKGLGLADMPDKCPTCLDKRQHRPDITLRRTEIFSAVCLITSLPQAQWERFQGNKDDRPSWHAVIKGNIFGASWQGRIDLWSHGQEPPRVGEMVRLIEMEVVKQVAKKSWERLTLEHGAVSGEVQVPMEQASEEGVRLVEEARRYIRLEPTKQTSDMQLIWVTAYTKTTLKGFGRQFWAHLEGNPIWSKEISGGARSGRFNTTGMLAIVDRDYPVIHIHTENGHTEETRIPAEEVVTELN